MYVRAINTETELLLQHSRPTEKIIVRISPQKTFNWQATLAQLCLWLDNSTPACVNNYVTKVTYLILLDWSFFNCTEMHYLSKIYHWNESPEIILSDTTYYSLAPREMLYAWLTFPQMFTRWFLLWWGQSLDVSVASDIWSSSAATAAANVPCSFELLGVRRSHFSHRLWSCLWWVLLNWNLHFFLPLLDLIDILHAC